jgi:CRISPR system Cascade subunit CasA
VTWPGRLLTGRSAHALLLIPSPDGRQVTDAFVSAGAVTKLPALDPFLIHHVDAARPAGRRHRPRRADADRALWRDLDALLLAGDETAAVRRPEAFAALNDLPGEVRAGLRVRVHGFDQEGRTNNRTWYTALTPPIWPWMQEHDPAGAERIAACRIAAEEVGALLEQVCRQAGRALAGAVRAPRRPPAWAGRAYAAYWPRAEKVFWRLIEQGASAGPDDPDDPEMRAAFAAEAVAVLREATRPLLARHFAAGPALARAVAQLRRPPASARRPAG